LSLPEVFTQLKIHQNVFEAWVLPRSVLGELMTLGVVLGRAGSGNTAHTPHLLHFQHLDMLPSTNHNKSVPMKTVIA